MGDILVFLVIATVVLVALIELWPSRLDVFAKILAAALITLLGTGWMPAWYGWLAALAGIGYGGWIWIALKRPQAAPDPLLTALRWGERVSVRIFEMLGNFLPRLARRGGASAAAGVGALARHRWFRGKRIVEALVLIAMSPIAAALVTVLLMAALGSSGSGVAGGEGEAPELVRHVLGTSFLVWLAALDGAIGNAAVAVPLLVGIALIGVGVASDRRCGMPAYLALWLLLGAVYPGLLFAQELLGAGREPMFT